MGRKMAIPIHIQRIFFRVGRINVFVSKVGRINDLSSILGLDNLHSLHDNSVFEVPQQEQTQSFIIQNIDNKSRI
jgi:hypothetical protein